jgi:hypothetical protein
VYFRVDFAFVILSRRSAAKNLKLRRLRFFAVFAASNDLVILSAAKDLKLRKCCAFRDPSPSPRLRMTVITIGIGDARHSPPQNDGHLDN